MAIKQFATAYFTWINHNEIHFGNVANTYVTLNILNSSFLEGRVPDQWEKVIVVPGLWFPSSNNTHPIFQY